jgi:hypothetical protein
LLFGSQARLIFAWHRDPVVAGSLANARGSPKVVFESNSFNFTLSFAVWSGLWLPPTVHRAVPTMKDLVRQRRVPSVAAVVFPSTTGWVDGEPMPRNTDIDGKESWSDVCRFGYPGILLDDEAFDATVRDFAQCLIDVKVDRTDALQRFRDLICETG